MSELRLALFQTDLHWCEPGANRAMLEEKIWTLKSSVDLIVFPEMFTTGFSMRASEFAEHINGTTGKWMQQMARQTGALVAGSMMCVDQGRYYNRLLFAFPEGRVEHYDKRHLFSPAEEHKTYTAGTERKLMEYKGWKIFPQVCYDLRFPVFSRNDLGFDLLLYVANWPQARIFAWQTLLKARAIENQCYTIGVNRVGQDGNNWNFPGSTMVCDFLGQTMVQAGDQPEIIELTLRKDELQEFRTKLDFLADRDQFDLKL
jgi:omega-amidase